MIRRRRATLLVVVLAVVLGIVLTRGGPAAPPHAARRATHLTRVTTARTHVVVRTALLRWRLPNPISREAVFARGTHVLVAGGLVGGNSQNTVATLDLRTGAMTTVGALAIPIHDAASFSLGSAGVVVGGGTVAPAANVQTIPAEGTATVSATLAAARADASGAAVGGVGYVVGGYDGPALEPAVLATRDGKSFSIAASLAVPVRYPAVAALGGALYAFGGTTLAGTPVNAIQQIDLATGRVRVLGHIPVSLGGAVAGVLNGTIYLAGGESPAGDSSAVYAFSTRTKALRLVAHLPVPLAYGGAAVLGNRLYLLGGENTAGVALPTAEFVAVTRS